ncbi:hypothetical protein SNEBB_009578 [Seison nebaliae]|nr:hypothetical protein SNEBB_009578 [Seison nebaliae]
MNSVQKHERYRIMQNTSACTNHVQHVRSLLGEKFLERAKIISQTLVEVNESKNPKKIALLTDLLSDLKKTIVRTDLSGLIGMCDTLFKRDPFDQSYANLFHFSCSKNDVVDHEKTMSLLWQSEILAGRNKPKKYYNNFYNNYPTFDANGERSNFQHFGMKNRKIELDRLESMNLPPNLVRMDFLKDCSKENYILQFNICDLIVINFHVNKMVIYQTTVDPILTKEQARMRNHVNQPPTQSFFNDSVNHHSSSQRLEMILHGALRNTADPNEYIMNVITYCNRNLRSIQVCPKCGQLVNKGEVIEAHRFNDIPNCHEGCRHLL